jgi:hypothetical protein
VVLTFGFYLDPSIHIHATHQLTPRLTILDRQLCRLRRQQRLLVPRQLLLDLAVAVVLDNLAAIAHKQLRVHQAVKVIPDGLWLCQRSATPYLGRGFTLKNSAFLMRSSKSFLPPSCLTTALAWWDCASQLSAAKTGELWTYQHANLLVGVLAGHAVGRELHQDGLGGHCDTC